MQPIHLTTHEQFEDLWFARKPGSPPIFLVWFMMRGCTPCQRIDKVSIEAAAYASGVPLYICEETVNDDTPGYCNVRTYPTFMLFTPQKVLAQLSSSDVYRVGMWISSEVAAARMQMRIIRAAVSAMVKPKVEMKKTM